MKSLVLFIAIAASCTLASSATIYVPKDYPTIQDAIDAASVSDTLIVWRQSNGNESQAFKSEYRSGVWSFPADLDDNFSSDGQNVYDIQAAMTDHGDALVVWRQSNGNNDQIFMSHFVGGQWTHPSGLADNISPDGQNASNPQVAMNSNGDALIVWSQSDGVNVQIFKSEYRSGVWKHPLDLLDNISPDARSASDAVAAMDDAGDALIVWTQSDGSDTQTFLSEYRGAQWDHPVDLNDNISPDGTPTWPAAVVMDALGHALIAWPQSNGTDYLIFMSEYRGGSWTHPSLSDHISPAGADAWFPSVALNDHGEALIAWPQYNGQVTSIFLSECRGGIWDHPLGLWDSISPGGEYAYGPFAAVGDDGDAIIAWHQSDGTISQIFMSEYRDGQWNHPLGLSDNISPDGGSALDATVSMSAHRDVIAWRQSDGSRFQVFKSEYRAGGWLHPGDLLDNISPDGENTYEPLVVTSSSAADTIIVLPGIYVENIDLAGKPLTVKSAAGPALTIIDGRNPIDPDRGSVVSFRNGEGPDSILDGFTLTNGTGTLDPLTSEILGGGIYCSGSSPLITNTVIVHNSAQSGGGISCSENSAPVVANSLVAHNNASSHDGGGFHSSLSTPLLVNNTIAANSAARSGGGVRADRDSVLTAANTILWDNTASTGVEISIGSGGEPSTVTIDYSDVEGGEAAVHVETGSTLNWGAAMIETDPLFAAPIDGDFHLAFDSPCRDGGDETAVSGTVDFEGDPRSTFAAVDMGADEFWIHLYSTGQVAAGSTIDIKIVAYPGFQSVQLGLGWGIADPPLPTRHGDLWLKLPLAGVRNPGSIPGDGILTFSVTLPSWLSQGDKLPFQTLVGTWGNTNTLLTNLMVLVVE